MSRPRSRSRRKREARQAARAARRRLATPEPVAWLDIPVVLRDWREQPAARRQSALARLLGIIAAIVAAGVGILLLVPLLNELFFMARSPVATVDGVVIETGRYAQARDFRRYEVIREINQLAEYRRDGTSTTAAELQAIDGQINEKRLSLASADFQAVEDLVNVTLLGKKALREGVVVTIDDIRAEQEAVLAPLPRPMPGGNGSDISQPAAGSESPAEPLEQRVAALLDDLDMPRDLFDDLMTMRAIERVYLNRAADSVATVQPHVHLKRIVLNDEEEAATYLKRYNAGESWSALTLESLEPEGEESAQSEGVEENPAPSYEADLGFVPRGILEPSLEAAAFSLDVGSVSEPVPTAEGFVILLVAGKVNLRAVSDEHLDQLRRSAVLDFRQELRESGNIEYQLDSDKVEWASRHGLRNIGELDADIPAGGMAR
ncbi:MAG: peptidyl-prolyl cis-trans isomerase [Chloroflexi bacterium]|nr:peptidyl-prolyl cis-trans isomerase [Chloroflexota bacterium]